MAPLLDGHAAGQQGKGPSGNTTIPRRAGAALLPVAILIGALAFPDTAAQSFAGLHLPIYRICLIFLLPMALARFIRNRQQITAPDLLMLAFAVLQAVSLAVHYDPLSTIEVERFGGGTTPTIIWINAGTTLLESVGPYFLARAFVRNRAAVAAVVRVFVAITLAVGATTLVEATTGVSLFGNTQDLLRFGLHRAAGPFPGPIQWGLFAASAFSLSLSRGVFGGTFLRRAGIAALVLVAALTSVSSAAIAAIAIQIMLIGWFYLSGQLKSRGAYFVAGCLAAYVFVDVFSNRTPVQVLFSYAALDPQTGFYRTLIWQFGWADFLNAPLFGIGYGYWARPLWMTSSIDAFWLVMLLRYGVLAAGPLIAGVVAALLRVARKLPRMIIGDDLDLSYGWIVSMISLVIGGFTVHLWEQSFVELFLLLGMWAAFVPLPDKATKRFWSSALVTSGPSHRGGASRNHQTGRRG
jgi:hypothetical protein